MSKGTENVLKALEEFEENMISKFDKIRNSMIVTTILFLVFVIIMTYV